MPSDEIQEIRAEVLKLVEWEKKIYFKMKRKLKIKMVWADNWCFIPIYSRFLIADE
jgi:hypothetical protein